ncbi:hypothetical protein GXW82_34910 [Streptacidiphilus sp. 4-A2]|nr:hypothetical protein [Streptacidiphilus sp. 4-A2]
MKTYLLRYEIGDTLDTQWQGARPLAAQLAAADRAEAHTLTSENFGSAFLNRSAAVLAQADLEQAPAAQALSGVSSQQQWLAQGRRRRRCCPTRTTRCGSTSG